MNKGLPLIVLCPSSVIPLRLHNSSRRVDGMTIAPFFTLLRKRRVGEEDSLGHNYFEYWNRVRASAESALMVKYRLLRSDSPEPETSWRNSLMKTAISFPPGFTWKKWHTRLSRSLLALSCLLPLSAQAQDCPGCASLALPGEPASGDEAWVIKKQVNEVSVIFTASAGGKLITDLTKDDVTIRDDEKIPAAIVQFHSQYDLPLRVGLLVDTSGSVKSRMRFERAAATAFLREVMQARSDLGFVMGFANVPTVTQDLTEDQELLSSGVAVLKSDGGTALFDAIVTACNKLSARSEQQVVAQVLVVLTDGDDNSSRSTLEDAIQAAQQAGIIIYTISSNPHDFQFDDTHHAENVVLKKLAEQTGGRALFPQCPRDVKGAFAKIQQELRCRYAVSYRPADFVPDGHYRHIKIVARKRGKNLHVRARRGYYAKVSSPALAWNRD